MASHTMGPGVFEAAREGGGEPGYGDGGLFGSERSSGEGCCDTAVTPSCPFFPQSTRLRPRQVAAFLLEPKCAWRAGHVWPCQL